MPPAPRRRRRGRRSSHPGCGFRSRSAGRRYPRRAIGLLWCSAARSAFSAPFSLIYSRRHPGGTPAAKKATTVFPAAPGAKFARAFPTTPLPRSDTQPRPGLTDRTFLSRHAASLPLGAGHSHPHAPRRCRRGAAQTPFLESPADSSLPAPNVPRLGQARRARQALVRKPKSTTKCGDCGDESGGDAQVSDIRSEFERA